MAEMMKRAGAAGAFQSLRTKTTGSYLAELVTGKVSLLLIAAVLVTITLPHEVEINERLVLWTLGIYFVYMLLLELASRRLTARYDEVWFKILRIQANIAVVSILLFSSSGVNSYFWFFYSLPIFATIIHFERLRYALLTYVEAVGFYLAVSLLAMDGTAESLDVGLFVMNSSILLLLLFVLFHLFRFASDRARLEHLRLAQQVAMEINTAIDLEELFEKTLAQVIAVVGARSGSLMLLSNEADSLKVHSWRGRGRTEGKEHRTFRLGEGIAGRVAERQKPYLCPDVTKDPYYANPIDGAVTGSLLSVPMLSHHHLIGVINVDSEKVGFFDEDDRQLLLTLATQVASAVERARLLRTLREVHEVGERTVDEELFLDRVADRICELLHVPVCVARLLDPDDRAFTVKTAIGLTDEYSRGLKLQLESPATKDFVERYFQEEEPLYISDVTDQVRAPKYRYRDVAEAFGWKSMLSAPLVTEGDVIGMIDVYSSEIRPFTSWERNVLVVIANEAASVLEHLRLDREIQQTSRQLEALRLTTLDITAQLDRDNLLQAIIQRAVELLTAKGGGIYEYKPGQGKLEVVADWGGKRSIVGNTLDFGEGMAGRVVKTGERLIVDDYRTWPNRAPGFEPDLFRAVVEVPLRWMGQIQGVLYVTDDTKGRVFTEGDADLLELLANQAAIAIGNAELFARTQRNLTQLEALNRINTNISSALSLTEMMQVTLEEGLKAIGADEGSLMLIDPTTRELEIKAWIVEGDFIADKPLRKLALGEGIAGHVAATGEAYNCSDVLRDSHFVESFTGRDLRSLLCVPILSHDRVLGVINADCEEPHFFDERDMQFISTLAGHVAVAIESQRLRDIGLALSTLSLDESLSRIVERACVLTGTEYTTVFLIDEKSGGFERASYYPVSREPREPPRKDGLTWQIVESGKPIVIEDTSQDPRVKKSVKDDEGVTSLVGVPLTTQVERNGHAEVINIGVLFADTTQHRHFTKRDVELLQSLASQASLAIQRARLHEEVAQERDRSKWMASALLKLQWATAEMQSELERTSLLSLVAEQAAKLLEADAGAILLLDEARQYLTIQGAFGLSDQVVRGTRDKIGASIAGRVVKLRKPIIANDIPNHPWYDNPATEGEGILAIVSTPMWIGGEIVGTLDIHSKSTRHAFKEDDLQILSLMARHAEVAIEKAQLFQETHRRARALETLHQISLDITSYRQLPELVQSILERAVELFEAKSAALYLLDDSGERAKLVATQNLPQALIGRTVKVGNSVVGRVIRTKTTFTVSDYRTWEYRLRDEDEYGFTAVAGAAVARHGAVWGVITVQDDADKRTFDEEDEELLTSLGNIAAVALDNARRTDELERLMSSAIDAIVAVDEDGNVVRCNTQAERILGYGAGELVAKPVESLYHDPDEPRRIKQRLLESKDGRLTDRDTFVRSQDGEKVPIRLSTSLLFDYEGEPAGSVGFFRDLREIKSAKREIQRLRSLLEAGQAITQLKDSESVLGTIADKTMEALQADAIGLYLYDQEHDVVQSPPVMRGLKHETAASLDVGPGSIVRKVIRHGEVHYADRAQTDSLLSGPFVEREEIVSCAACPLKAGDTIVGVLFCNYRDPHPFSKEEETTIRLFANEAAVALANAELFREVHGQAREFRTLNQIAMAAASALELDKVLQATADSIADSLGYMFVGIRLIDQMTGELTGPTYYAGLEASNINVSREKGIIGRVVRTGESALVSDVSRDTDYFRAVPETQSELCVPLTLGERLIGVINIESTEPDAFTEHDRHLVETIAGQVVNSIENARLYTQLEKAEKRLAARTALVEFANAKTTWMHSLESKATALIGAIETVAALPSNDSPALEEHLVRMRQHVKELADIPQVTPIGPEGDAESVPLKSVIREILNREIKEEHDGTAAVSLIEELEIGNDITVRAVRRWLTRAFENIIHNALAVMPEGGYLKVTARHRGHTVEIRFIDSGPGFPQSVQPYLFKSHVPKEKGAKGMGIGLWWTRTILQDIGGEITWRRDDERGETTIVVQLPVER